MSVITASVTVPVWLLAALTGALVGCVAVVLRNASRTVDRILRRELAPPRPAATEVELQHRRDLRDPALRARVLRRDGSLCRYCRTGPLNPRQVRSRDAGRVLQLVHVDPASPAGRDGANLVTACRSCAEKSPRPFLLAAPGTQIVIDGDPPAPGGPRLTEEQRAELQQRITAAMREGRGRA